MNEAEIRFFEVLQVALGKRSCLDKLLTNEEWGTIYALAQKHAIAGVAFEALDVLSSQEQRPPKELLFEWIGLSEQIKQRNFFVNDRCEKLEKIINEGGFRCCVLKGQGSALYYEHPESRQCGDIDVWVDGDRDKVLAYIKEKGYHVGHVDIKHSDVEFFEDVPVEVHFMPSWIYSPSKNKTLQRFFKEKADSLFRNYDKKVGFTHTTVEFDLVYSLVHIYRHVFDEGIGLRQLLDYYHILINSTAEQRKEAWGVVFQLGMAKFAGGVMCVLRECFMLKPEYYLCEVNIRHGKHLLKEILLAGNFGHYDGRYCHGGKDDRLANGFTNIRRNFNFLFYYTSEVLWAPIWKVWHWCWRKRKGYL